MNGLQQDLLNTVDRISGAHCERPLRESAEAGTWPAALWQALDEVGLTKAALPEAAGGSGLEFGDAMLALRRSAYHAFPVPLAETMMAGRLLAAAGLAVPEGALTIAPVMQSDALDIKSGKTVSGEARRVPWGNQCAHVVVAGENEIGVVVLKSHSSKTEKNLAGEPRVTLKFASQPLAAFAPLAGARARLDAEGALARSVQMAGALERALAYALQYAGERVQFGRPIGKFQAIQQLLAQFAEQVAAATVAVTASADAIARGGDVFFAAAVAKIRAGEAAGRSAEIAHQVHGAIGFTHEHRLHHLTRRLWSWRDEFGVESEWSIALGRQVAAQGAEAFWPRLTA